jgi:hypothetical protein
LWDTLEQGKECFAYVKNMCKDGSYYWVFANITPDLDEKGRVIGYFSVRRKAKPAAIAVVADVYKAMLAEENRVGPKDACAASLALLGGVLEQKGLSYEQLILSL